MAKLPYTLSITCILALLSSCSPSRAQVAITLDPNTTYQTITGWEGAAQIGQFECPSFNRYKNDLLDRIAFELGINRLRIEIGSGTESPTDFFGQFINGQIGYFDWVRQRFIAINDNNDPSNRNNNGFHFGSVDHQINTVFLPLKQRLASMGETLFLNLTYVHFNPNNSFHVNNPDEYAEFVLAVYDHMQATFGFVPDTWEVILEPDNVDTWDGTKIGRVIAATASRLQAAGYTPRFIAPSTAGMGGVFQRYFDAMAAVPGAIQPVKEIAYHRYRGAEPDNVIGGLQGIVQRARQHGLETAMLEHIGSDYEDLHQDLSVANVTAWEQYSLAFCDTNDNGGRYYNINERDPSNPVVEMGSRTRFLRQYYRWVRRGAVRIRATSSSGTFEPLGFINTNGNYVVVVKANDGGAMRISGLPAGSYEVRYTTDRETNVDGGSMTLNTGQTLEARIPARGVLTVYATSTQATGEETPDEDTAPGFSLHQNYPNPFNLGTTIAFDLPAPTHAVLTLYDVSGRELATLLDTHLPAGRHQMQWQADAYPGGTYFYHLEAGTYRWTKHLILIR